MQRFSQKNASSWLVLSMVFSSVAFGQGIQNITVSGQLRHRTEYSAKDFDAQQDNVSFHLLRTRLNFAARPIEDVAAFVQFQDSRVFGEETSTLSDGSADNMDVHQAYIQIDDFFGIPVIARLGRQEINVGNQRLVGAVGWSNIGRAFDGVHFQYPMESGTLTFFAARLAGSMNAPSGQNLYGITGAFPFSEGHTLDIVALLDNNSAAVPAGPALGEQLLSRYTAGATATGLHKGIDYEFEAFYQGGNQARTGAVDRASISAYLLSAKVGVLVSDDRNMRIGGLFTIVSGDDGFGDDEYNAFSTLFATNHKFYGFMDYFTSFGGPSGVGLRDLAASMGLNASEAFRLVIDLHHFTADKTPAGMDDTFGQEIDLTGTYRYNRALMFTIGVAAFAPGDLMKDMQGEDTAFWGYVMTTLNL